MKFPLQKSNQGVALVTTIIVVAIMATITVALLQTTGIDRTSSRAVANNFQARLAAEAGFHTALSILRSSYGPNMTLSLNRTATNPANWTLQYNTVSLNGTILSSNSSLPTIAPIANQTHTFALPTGNRTAPKYPITSGNQTIGAFSYVVIDNTAKQSLDRFPVVSPRTYSTSLNQVPFISSNLSVVTGLSNNITSNSVASLPSVATANFLLGQNLGINATWTDTQNFSPPLAPDGNPKLNLRRLKSFVDSRAITQTANNPKSQIVEALLGQSTTINATASWGGGGLSWLISPANPQPYTLTEARQIAANLIDYIDADLHTTTDNVDNPTYFGTEARLNATGVQGHPYVTAVGFGLVFNRSGASGLLGSLNSTRVLAYWSLVNPWPSAITMNLGATYTVNITVSVSGSASGGNLGNNASAYFLPLSSEPPPASLPSFSNERLTEGPTTLNANSGSTFPQNPSGMSFANFYDMNNTPSIGRQPAGMSFSNITFRIERLRLSFRDSSGLTSVVQVLDRLNTMPVSLHINSFTLPTASGPVVYNPGTVRNGLFLNGDPRLHFRSDQWVSGNMTAASATSAAPPEKTAPELNMFNGMNATHGDGQQGLPTNHTWYSSTSTRNHFFVRSPENLTSATYNATAPPNGQVAMESVAEMGYFSTGRPWQTLRMVVDPDNTAAGGDYSILDYIDTGTFSTSNQTVTLNGATSNQTVVNGKVNPNTLLRPTAVGLFQDTWLSPSLWNPSVTSDQASSIATLLSTSGNFTGYPIPRAGGIGALPQMAVNGATTKFAREELMRRVTNLLTTQSTDFTIISHGEARNPINNRIVSAATMESRVRINLTPNGIPVASIISRKIE